MRVGTGIVADLRKVEVKMELRKRYLFQEDSQSGASSEEDVVQLHEYAAAAGEASAQTRLGELHLVGLHGLSQSFERARLLFEAAARQGDARGCALLAFMLEKSYGGPGDAGRALELYEQAARENDVFAHTRLGFAHMEGRLGLVPDPKVAEHHFTVSSKSGSGQAWLGLGLLALRSDPKKAAKLLAVAAQKGSIIGAFELARLQVGEDMVLCNAAVQNLAHVFEWSSPVRHMLERAYNEVRRRNNVEGNLTLALELYEMLAWAGVEEAQANAAFLYHHRLNDLERAIRYYELSAEQGNAHSHLMIGDFYYRKANLNISHTAYRRAAELHHFEAMYNLGYMYLFGEGVPSPDPHLAKRYFDLSLSTNPAAFYAVSLSLLYLQLTTSPISSLVRKVNLFFWWNEGVVMAILVIVLISLLSARMARQ